MGLCKCPRKKVTNLFCFEHRVNVCEHCLVSNHSKCVVQSYLAWLQDSDYDPNCSLCGLTLGDTSKDCARLLCMHLYHWECLDRWAKSFPAHTAPAGYRCPTCQEGIFPKPNQVSPVIEALKEMLKQTNWARAGLGLPLMPELANEVAPAVHNQQTTVPAGQNYNDFPPEGARTQQTVLSMDNSIQSTSGMMERKPLSTTMDNGGYNLVPPPSSSTDEDLAENKYKRRSAADWLKRFINSRSGGRGMDPLRGYKRWFFLLLILLIGVVTVITILTRVSKSREDTDPFLDPVGNPNIRAAPPGQDFANMLHEE